MKIKSILNLPVFIVAVCSLALPAKASLVGHWTFDEGAGTNIYDSSGQGNHGLLVNPKANTWTNGTSGGGLYFDGTTGAGSTYVTIPDAASLHITNAISFAAWIRCDDTGRDAPILDKEGSGKLSYWFGTYGTAYFGVLLDVDGNSPWTVMDRDNGVVSQGLWVHVASTWDGATIRHYLNGVQLQQTTAFSGLIHVSDAALIIGANVPYNSTAFKGIIDDARLYDHALSLEEVRALVGTTRQLVGHWSFDEGGGTNIVDSSGQANHGTLINPKTNTWTAGINHSALYFDGTVGIGSTYVAVPDAPSLHIAAEISFAAWVRCDDIVHDAPIMAKEGAGKLSYWFGASGAGGNLGSGSGNFGMLLDLDGNQPWTTYDCNQGAIPQGQWVHLASTWDGTTIRHYFNGQPLAQTGTFPGPIYVSDALLAIGVNSLYNFDSTINTAFMGAINEVYLYNYALTPAEIRSVYSRSALRFISVVCEGNDLRLTWTCVPGQSYEVQTNPVLNAGVGFAGLASPIVVPEGYSGDTTNYLHCGALTNGAALYYRLKLLP